jgi:hypothetical protein
MEKIEAAADSGIAQFASFTVIPELVSELVWFR